MSGVTVSVDGLDKLQKKCALVAAEEAPRGLVRDLAAYTRSRIAIHARPHGADKGTLGAGAKVELSSPGEPLAARVGYLGRGYGMRSSVTAIARAVNDGQPPRPERTKRQLLGMAYALGRWGQAHGYIVAATVPPKTKRGRKPQPSPEAMALAVRVARVGTRGVHFMEKAEDEAGRKAQDMVKSLAGEYERRWGH